MPTAAKIDYARLLGREPIPMDVEAARAKIAGKRVLVTGAGGSIGSEVCQSIGSIGVPFLGFVDRDDGRLCAINERMQLFPCTPRCRGLVDVSSAEMALRMVRDLTPNIVIHCAAYKHVPLMEDHPIQAIVNNVLATKYVVDACIKHGVENFVLVSTDKAVYPKSIMGATKRLAEIYTLSQLPGTVVRFGNVIGSSGSVLEIWQRQAEEGKPITVTHPDMTRYFMHLSEAAAAVIESIGKGGVYTREMGGPVNIADMADRFAAEYGVGVEITGIRPGEKMHEQIADNAWATANAVFHPSGMIADLESAVAYGDPAKATEAIWRWA